MGGESVGVNEFAQNTEYLQQIKPRFEAATKQMKATSFEFAADPTRSRSFALGRLLLRKNSKLKFMAPLVLDTTTEGGINFVNGCNSEGSVKTTRTWIELNQEGQVIVVVPQIGKKYEPDSFNVATTSQADKVQTYQDLGIIPLPMDELKKATSDDREFWRIQQTISSINEGGVPADFAIWWSNFRDVYGFWQSTPEVENFISRIPMIDRNRAIEKAQKNRKEFIQKLWKSERSLLPKEYVVSHLLSEDLNGWESYLKKCFEKELDFNKRKGFEDWKAKYVISMANKQESEENYMRWTKVDKLTFPPLKRKSMLEHHFDDRMRDTSLFLGEVKPIEPNSILVHSLDEHTLLNAIRSGVVGRGGAGAVALCKDRIVYDRDNIIAFQVKDLQAAGYTLLSVMEDFRDADILQEWRSIPLDLSLARTITSISSIPDKSNASKAQIATSFFGVDYLKNIERV